MTVDSIQTTKVNAPQFKAAENPAMTPEMPKTQEPKKDGNKLLYGSLAGLGVVALAGVTYAALKGKKVDFAKFKQLGYKFENGKMLNKKGKAYTGKMSGTTKSGNTVTVDYKNGIKEKVTVKYKDGDNKSMTRTYTRDENGKVTSIKETIVGKDGNAATTETPVD